MIQLCQHSCGLPATYTTKSSLKSGPFKGNPVYQCAKSHNSCPAVKQKKINSSIRKYGTAYPWQTADIVEKRNQTNLKKYGHNSSLLNADVQAKRKATMLDRYGVEEPIQNEQIKAKAAASVKQSYINDPTLSQKQIQAKKEKYGENYAGPVAKSLKTEWAQYKFRVKYLTAKAYKKFKSTINPGDLPIGRCEYQVDHIYSIRHGFENKVDPSIIANISNLRILWHTENKSKHIRSDITLEELIKITKG